VRRLIGLIILVVAAVLLVSACGRKLPAPLGIQLGPGVSLGTMPDAASNFGGEAFTFTATMTSGTGVTSWSWDFGGGAIPNTATGSGNSSSVNVTLVNPSLTADESYSGSFTATDVNGSTTKTFEYTVGPTQNRAPTVTLTYADGVLTATAADEDGDELTFTFTVDSGDVTVTPATIGPTSTYVQTATVAAAGFEDVDFTITVTVDDGMGGTDSDSVSDTLVTPKPPDNAIWMTVDKTTVAVGDTIVLTVWAYNTANPLRYLDSAMVEYEGFGVGGATLTTDTFNLGAVGGDAGDVDGFWTLVPGGNFGLVLGGISLFGPYDADYFVDDVQVPAGRKYIAVNVSPTFTGTPGEAPAGSTGALFNVTLTAETAGTAEFHFVHEYSQSAGGAIIAGTMYSSDENTHYSFVDDQSLEITVE